MPPIPPMPPMPHAEAAAKAAAHAEAAAKAAALPAALEALREAGHALLALLRQADVQGLAAHHLQVHLRHGLRRLLWRHEANEAEALRGALVINGDLRRGDLPERAEEFLQLVISDGLVQVLDVQVDGLAIATLALALPLPLHNGAELLSKLARTLRLRHCAANEQAVVLRLLLFLLLLLLALLLELLRLLLRLLLLLLLVGRLVLIRAEIFALQRLNCLLGHLGFLEVHEREAAPLRILLHQRRGHGPELAELLLNRGFIPAPRHVLHVEIREVLRLRVAFSGLHVLLHAHSFLADLHIIHALDRLLRRVLRLEVHEPVTLRLASLITSDLAGEDVAEEAERIVEGLVVDLGVQVLHEGG